MITLVALYLEVTLLIASFSHVKKIFFDLNAMGASELSEVELYLGHIQMESFRKILAANEWREVWKWQRWEKLRDLQRVWQSR